MPVPRPSSPRPGRPPPDVSDERRARAVAALTANPNLPHDELAALLGVSRPSATRIAGQLVRARKVRPRHRAPVAGASKQYRVPEAAAERLQRLTAAESLADAVTRAADELERHARGK